jgi:hypothetical protein
LPDTLFTIRPADVAHLNPEGAVQFFQELAWAEARRAGLPTTQVHVSRWIDVPDGGVDASVDANVATEIFSKGHNGFQIKAGSTFKPWNKSHIKRSLFEAKTPAPRNLGESVRACLDRNGRYVLLCTGTDPNDLQRRAAVKHLGQFFAQCGYKTAKVAIWGQTHLIGLLKRFPSLSLQLNGRGGFRFQSHVSWSQQADMRKSYKAGPAQQNVISSIMAELRRHERASHIRVWGEAGIGKTRLVLKATEADDLRPLIIYCDNPEKLRDSDLMNELLREDTNFSAIIVVDECDPEARAYLWNRFANSGPRIKLLSIYGELDKPTGDIEYLSAPLLEKEQITEIIKEYIGPDERAERWAEFCTGSPRMAHMIGLNLKNNPEDLLRSPDTVNVWDRFIVGGDDAASPLVAQRRLLLRYVALFKRFGYGKRLIAEAKVIAAHVERADPAITWTRFQELVNELKAKKLLQGENTLYITPKLLHIKLWTDWWDTYGSGFPIAEFTATLPPKLREWFDEMFKYAQASKAAQIVVKELLDENGSFGTGEYFRDARGAEFFLALSEANPEAALRLLVSKLGTATREELTTFTEGRREVIWALERMAVWRELFPDAARLLLRLGEAENETWGNNASGVFAELFSPGPGRVAPTEAPPEERFPILKEALESASKAQRLLALRACDAALESQQFTRATGAEHQGLRREPHLWVPSTYGEIFDAYRRVWQLLTERMDVLDEDERQKAVTVLLNNAGGLARYANLLDMVVDTLGELAAKPYADKRKVIEAVERILRYQGKELPREMRDRWVQLKRRLVGNDFHSLTQRYVAMDLLEDQVDEAGEVVDQATPRIERLAKQAIERPELLEAELPWLVTGEAKNGFRFGYALGAGDPDFALLPRLLAALRGAGPDASAFFLGGYVRAMHERDERRWDALLDEIAGDEILRTWVPELTWRSRLTDNAGLRVLYLAENGAIKVSDFQMFSFGSATANLSEDIFTKWIEFLLRRPETEATSIALELAHFYYGRKDAKRILPRELTLKLLVAERFFEKSNEQRRSQMEEYHWTEMGKQFVRLYPAESLKLADKILEHFGEDGTIVGGFNSTALRVLEEITRQSPKAVWNKVTTYLGPPVDARAYHIGSWLQGKRFWDDATGALPLIPPDEIWRWVNEDVKTRAPYIADIVPKQLFRVDGNMCLAREVLVRYGASKDVRSSLTGNFSSEGWSGPASLHYEARKRWLLDFKRGETNADVRRWIDEYVALLDRQIEHAKIEEEREH